MSPSQVYGQPQGPPPIYPGQPYFGQIQNAPHYPPVPQSYTMPRYVQPSQPYPVGPIFPAQTSVPQTALVYGQSASAGRLPRSDRQPVAGSGHGQRPSAREQRAPRSLSMDVPRVKRSASMQGHQGSQERRQSTSSSGSDRLMFAGRPGQMQAATATGLSRRASKASLKSQSSSSGDEVLFKRGPHT